MNARHAATGTLLVASLALGGGSVADADPRPAMDRMEVPCAQIERRLEQLAHQQSILEARRTRLQARLETAVAEDDERQIHRVEAQLRQVDRVAGHLEAAVTRVNDVFAVHCEPDTAS